MKKEYTTGLLALGGVAALYFLNRSQSTAASNVAQPGGYWYRYTTPGTPGYTPPNSSTPNGGQDYIPYTPYRHRVGYSPSVNSGGSSSIPVQLPLTAPSTPVKTSSPLPDHSPNTGYSSPDKYPLDYVYVTPQAYIPEIAYTPPEAPSVPQATVSATEGYQIPGYTVEVTPENSYFNPPADNSSTPNVSATEGYAIPGYYVPVTPINPNFAPTDQPINYVYVTQTYKKPIDYVPVTPQYEPIQYVQVTPAAYTPPSYTPPTSYTPPAPATYSPPSPGDIQYVQVTPQVAPYHAPNLEYNYSDWQQRYNAWVAYLNNVRYSPPSSYSAPAAYYSPPQYYPPSQPYSPPNDYSNYFNNDYGGNYVYVTPAVYQSGVGYNNAYAWWYANM